MKKSYLMIAAATALFAACSSNDAFKEIDTQDAPIAFDQAINKTTRAYIADKAGLITAGGFGVYGYKNPGQSQQTIFNNVQVNSTDQGTTWTYSPLRFWDKTQSYDFYAIAPYKESGYSINTSTGMFTITSVASAISTASDDYIIDRNGNKGVSGNYTDTHNKVTFDFHHIMAKVEFALKSTLSQGTINVTRLVMSGWDNGNGRFVQTLDDTPSTLVYGEWTISNPSTSGSVTLIGSGASESAKELTCSTNATASKVTDWYIMVPQSVAALTFTVDYTFTDGTYVETFTNQVATLSTAQIWGTDSHTTYTLDIKPAAIEFDVTSICGFEVSGTDPNVTVK